MFQLDWVGKGNMIYLQNGSMHAHPQCNSSAPLINGRESFFILDSELALCLVLINRIWKKWDLASPKLRPQKFHGLYFSLGNCPEVHMRNCDRAFWRTGGSWEVRFPSWDSAASRHKSETALDHQAQDTTWMHPHKWFQSRPAKVVPGYLKFKLPTHWIRGNYKQWLF